MGSFYFSNFGQNFLLSVFQLWPKLDFNVKFHLFNSLVTCWEPCYMRFRFKEILGGASKRASVGGVGSIALCHESRFHPVMTLLCGLGVQTRLCADIRRWIYRQDFPRTTHELIIPRPSDEQVNSPSRQPTERPAGWVGCHSEAGAGATSLNFAAP